jgi:hypothetical protein
MPFSWKFFVLELRVPAPQAGSRPMCKKKSDAILDRSGRVSSGIFGQTAQGTGHFDDQGIVQPAGRMRCLEKIRRIYGMASGDNILALPTKVDALFLRVLLGERPQQRQLEPFPLQGLDGQQQPGKKQCQSNQRPGQQPAKEPAKH